MDISKKDIDAIWDIFVQKTCPKLVKQLKPVRNLLGSAEHHKKLFIEAVNEYEVLEWKKNDVQHVSIPEVIDNLDWFNSLDVGTIIDDRWEKMDYVHGEGYVKYIPDRRIVHFSWIFVDGDFEKVFK